MRKPPRITWRGGQRPAIKSRHLGPYLSSDADDKVLAIAKARKQIIDFIFVIKQARGFSLRQAIVAMQERIAVRRIPQFILDALHVAHGRPNRIGSVNISIGTLFRWVRAYRQNPYDPHALAPHISKAIYANTNRRIKRPPDEPTSDQ